MHSHSLYVDPEGAVSRYIEESLLSGRDRFVEACGIGHYLGGLPSRNGVAGTEGVVGIAGDYPLAGQTPDVSIEGTAGQYVIELDSAGSRCGGGGGHGRGICCCGCISRSGGCACCNAC